MRISDHCYAIVGFEDLVNAGFVVGRDGVVVIDTTMFPHSAQFVAEYARLVSKNRRIQAVFNTHWHADHVLGNQVLRERGATVVAHELTRRALGNLQDYPRRVWELTGRNVYYKRLLEPVKVVVPDQGFESQWVLDLGDVSVKAVHLPGHTRSDVAIYVPEDGVVFAGDLLYVDMPPNLKFGNPVSWMGSLETILTWDFHTVVPGHGPLGRRPDVERQRELLAELLERLASLKEITQEGLRDALKEMGFSEASLKRIAGLTMHGVEWPDWPYQSSRSTRFVDQP